MSQSDGISVGRDGAAVGPGVPRPDVVDLQVVAGGETVPRVRAHHHLPGRQHVRPVLPDHHELAQVLRGAVESHLVSHRGSVVARLRSDDRSDGDCSVVSLVGLGSTDQQEGSQQPAVAGAGAVAHVDIVVVVL